MNANFIYLIRKRAKLVEMVVRKRDLVAEIVGKHSFQLSDKDIVRPAQKKSTFEKIGSLCRNQEGVVFTVYGYGYPKTILAIAEEIERLQGEPLKVDFVDDKPRLIDCTQSWY